MVFSVKQEKADQNDAASSSPNDKSSLYAAAAESLAVVTESARWMAWFGTVVVAPPLLLLVVLFWMTLFLSLSAFLALRLVLIPHPIETFPIFFDFQPFRPSGADFLLPAESRVVGREEVLSRPRAVGEVLFDQPAGWQVTPAGARIFDKHQLNSTINNREPLHVSISVRLTHDAHAHLYSSPWVSSQAVRALYDTAAAPIVVKELPPWPVGLSAELKTTTTEVVARHSRSFVPRRDVPSWFWGYGKGLLFGLGFRE